MRSPAEGAFDLFRWSWTAFCCGLWWAAAEMTGHRSASPVVLGRWSGAWGVALTGAASAAAVASAALLPRVYPRFRAVRGALAFSGALTLVLFTASLELLFRMDFLGASYHEETARYLRETLPDLELNYRHRPTFQTRYQGRPIVFNELGLRDRPLPANEEGETRVVILGDSVAFGWGISEEETFGRRLEGLLKERLRSPVRTINTGVCSYNTVQQLRYLRRAGAHLAPDAVLLLYVENDVKPFIPVNRSGSTMAVRGHPGPLADWLLAQSWTYRVAYHLSRPMLAGEPLDRRAKGYAESMRSLAELASLSGELGAPFGVLVFRMSRREASDRLVADIVALGAGADFPVADTAPWFVGQNLRRLTNSITDTHPNPAGHAILADGAATFLIRGRLVTASAAPR